MIQKRYFLPGETVFISLKTPDFNKKLPPFELVAQKALEKGWILEQQSKKLILHVKI